MKVLGCIIAGGKSSRMGRDKALMEWRGKPLIEHVATRLAPQVDRLVINANSDAEQFAFLNFAVIADRLEIATPVAGLHAALSYAAEQGFDAVLTTPCDSPLLPIDLRERLHGPGAAIAMSAGQPHYLTGFWPVSTVALFEPPTLRRVMDFADAAKARHVEWNASGLDPFTNLNTPEDLASLLEIP